MQKKKCTKCGVKKDLTEFYKDKSVKCGVRSQCKECINEYNKENVEKYKERIKEYYNKNKIEIIEKQKLLNSKNKEKLAIYGKEYRSENKEKIAIRNKKYVANKMSDPEFKKKYLDNLRKKLLIKRLKYLEDNKEEIEIEKAKNKIKAIKKASDNHMKRYHSDINYKLAHNLRSRIKHAVKNGYKSASTLTLLGCTVGFLKTHLSKQFTKGMTFVNYGEWHIDHIKPCSKFDLTKPEQQKECFNYKNLQPLWAKDNLSKGSKY